MIELNITPDRGYCFSVRGLGRELACSLDVGYTDPAARVEVPAAQGEAWPVVLADPACPRFVASRVDGVDPTAAAPWWMQRRLLAAGMRPISLIVDVTNYVMLELGQPLHAYDASRVAGAIVVRRARTGEKLRTLDDVERTLNPDDLLITDDSGPIGLAGVMGGASTEISGPNENGRIDVLIEAAHFDPAVIARAARRHKLPSEASRRFERVVDPQLPPVAAERAAQLLVEHGGGTIVPGRTDAGAAPRPTPVEMPLELPDRVAGIAYPPGATVRRLTQIGCSVELVTGDDGRGHVVAMPPSWRPDLGQPADLVEEVLRLEGLRRHPVGAARRPARAWPDPDPAAPSRRFACAGRGRVRRGAAVPVRRPGCLGRLRPRRRRRPAPHRARAQPARRRACRAGRHTASGLARRPDPQPLPRRHRPGALPHRPGRPAACEARADARSRRRRPPVRRGARADRGSPARPARTRRRGAGRRPRGARLVGPGPGRELGRRRGGRAPGRAGRRRGAACHGGVASLRSTPAVVLRCAWATGSSGTRGSCTPRSWRPSGCRSAPGAMELDLDLLPVDDRRPAPQVSPYPPIAVDVALVADASVPAAQLADALSTGAASCWRTSGSSTSTRASR